LVPRIHALIGPQITLTITVHGELTVWQDPDQLEQVILQLATNAAEAMPASGHLVITARPVALGQPERPVDDRPGDVDYIKLTVSDDGPGMNEETLARIFEPFFTTRTAGNHSGLGLSMCRGIVEQSGGHLTAQSQLGEGTALSIHLLATNTVPDLHQNVPAPLSAVAGVPTILFVDDEPMLRDIGEAILSEAGYRVIVAEDGPSALARLAELSTSPLDLLLTDVVMPGMNGVQVAAEVERLRPGTRVLLCSGYTRDALAANGLPPGVAFLSKPYTLAGLLEKVTALLSSP
jgi:CheY-like chemotaxis protein